MQVFCVRVHAISLEVELHVAPKYFGDDELLVVVGDPVAVNEGCTGFLLAGLDVFLDLVVLASVPELLKIPEVRHPKFIYSE